jgi:hypothetical protein
MKSKIEPTVAFVSAPHTRRRLNLAGGQCCPSRMLTGSHERRKTENGGRCLDSFIITQVSNHPAISNSASFGSEQPYPHTTTDSTSTRSIRTRIAAAIPALLYICARITPCKPDRDKAREIFAVKIQKRGNWVSLARHGRNHHCQLDPVSRFFSQVLSREPTSHNFFAGL